MALKSGGILGPIFNNKNYLHNFSKIMNYQEYTEAKVDVTQEIEQRAHNGLHQLAQCISEW